MGVKTYYEQGPGAGGNGLGAFQRGGGGFSPNTILRPKFPTAGSSGDGIPIDSPPPPVGPPPTPIIQLQPPQSQADVGLPPVHPSEGINTTTYTPLSPAVTAISQAVSPNSTVPAPTTSQGIAQVVQQAIQVAQQTSAQAQSSGTAAIRSPMQDDVVSRNAIGASADASRAAVAVAQAAALASQSPDPRVRALADQALGQAQQTALAANAAALAAQQVASPGSPTQKDAAQVLQVAQTVQAGVQTKTVGGRGWGFWVAVAGGLGLVWYAIGGFKR